MSKKVKSKDVTTLLVMSLFDGNIDQVLNLLSDDVTCFGLLKDKK